MQAYHARDADSGEIQPHRENGAGDGYRTRGPQLGKLMLYH